MLRSGRGTNCGRLGSTRVHTLVRMLYRTHPQLDILYISTIIKPLVRAEVSITIAAIQAPVSQITDSYLSTYRKAWMAKQKAIADLFGDWAISYSMFPLYMGALYRENPDPVVVWRYEVGPRVTRTNSNECSGRFVRPSKAS